MLGSPCPFIALLALLLSSLVNAAAPALSIAAAKKLDVDACASLAQTISSYGFASVPKVAACYDTFPYDSAIASTTLRMIRSTLESFYVFRETSLTPPDPSFQKAYDVIAALAQVEKKTFRTDRAFHEAVAQSLIPLNDGHVYYSPSCYSPFSFYQPFFMTSILEASGFTRLLVHSVDLDFPDEFQKWVGAEVVSIEGENPLVYLQAFADSQVGQSKDPHTRLARTMAYRYWDDQDYTYNRGAFSLRDSVPKGQNVTYTFKLNKNDKPIKVSVPWRAILTNLRQSMDSDTPFTSAQTYHSRYCIALPLNIPSAPYIKRTEADASASNVTQSSAFKSNTADVSSEEPKAVGWPRPDTPVAKGPGFAFFLSRQSTKAGVLVISSFPSIDPGKWIEAMLNGFNTLEQYGVQRLILDLSNNEGGDGCLANFLISLFNPSPGSRLFHPAQPHVSNIRLSSLIETIGKIVSPQGLYDHFLSPFSYLDPRTLQPFLDNNWRLGAKHLKYLGFKGSLYSRALLDRCVPPPKPTMSYDSIASFGQRPGGLVILTNGYCGSACATLASHLVETKKARILVTSSTAVSKGRSAPSLPTAWTFAGGQAISLSSMLFMLQAAKIPIPSSFPRLLPVSAEFFFPFRQTMSMTRPGLPLEYIRRPADAIVPITRSNVMQPHLIWHDVAISQRWVIKSGYAMA